MAVFTYSPYEVALLSGVGAFGAIVPAVAVWLLLRNVPSRIQLPPRPTLRDVPGNGGGLRQYRVRYAAISTAVFGDRCFLKMSDVPGPYGSLSHCYSTQDEEHAGRPTLRIDICGPAKDEHSAVETHADSARAFLPILSLSANAAVGEVRFSELLEEDTTAEPGGIVKLDPQYDANRILDPEATGELLDAVYGHPQRARIINALREYQLALRYVGRGRQTPVLAHLHRAMLITADAYTESFCIQRKCRLDQLAKSFGVATLDLSCHILRTMVYNDDQSHVAIASEAYSRFFEIPHPEHVAHWVTYPATPNSVTTVAAYARNALFALLGIDEKYRGRLCAESYLVPLGLA